MMSPLIGPDGTILITAGNGMKAFTASGAVLWTYSVSGDGGLIAYSDPVVDAEHNIYFVEKSERLTAPAIIVVRGGKRVAKLADVRDPHGRSFLMSRDGRVFYDAAGSIVYFESRGFDPSSPWPMSRGNSGRAARR